MKKKFYLVLILCSKFTVNFDSTLNLWNVQLNTTNDGAEKVEEYLTFTKQNMEDCSPIIYFGRLLRNELGQIDRAGKYFNILLKSLPSDHADIASVYSSIGSVRNERVELNLALKNHEKAYEIRRKQLPPDHIHIADSLNSIGNLHRRKENFDTALDYLLQAITIQEKNYQNDNIRKAYTFSNIGLLYCDKGDFDTALTYLSRAVEMYKRVLPDQHVEIALGLGEIAYVHEKKSDLDVALEYYHQQLNMEEQCIPFNHPNLSEHLDSIVDTYKKLGETQKGLEFCREKLAAQKNRLGKNHPQIARTLVVMASVCKDDNPDEALQYYEEALSILENSVPPDYQTISSCLIDMACLYSEYSMNEDAWQCSLKALELSRQVLSADHINIANNLRNIGIFYEDMNNLPEALRYLNESLAIYKLNYGPEHERLKLVENDIARLNNE